MNKEELRDLPRVERFKKFFDFEPFEYQQELIEYGETNDVAKIAVKPGRQVGKTITGGAIAAERALSGKDVMILAPFEDTGDEMMEAARNHLLKAEDKFSEAGFTLGTEQRNKRDWIFQNGGRLRARTVGTDGTQIRGKNPEIVLVDEAAYIKDKIFTEVVEPFFSTHQEYEFYLFSTPAGKNGYFYDVVQGDKAESWFSPHWPSKISPLISEEFLESKRQELDSSTYAQEYLGEFADEGDTLFTLEDIQPLLGEPELEGQVYLGVDVARAGKDRTVYTAVDESGNVRVEAVEDTSTMDSVLGRIKDLHRENNYTSIVVEENSMGGGVIDFNDIPELEAFTSTSKSQHKLYKQLQRDIENQTLMLPNNRRLIDELTSLEYDYTQHGYMKVSHPDGGHDDYPDSLAFANWGRNGGDKKSVTRTSARSSMQKRGI